MTNSQRFAYRSLKELHRDVARRGLDLPVSEDLSILARPARFGRLTLPNRLAVHPMEGCDAAPDGSPEGLTVRRYTRLGAGGAGLIWVEACAVVPEGRANPRQLWINDRSAPAFRAMLQAARDAARQAAQEPARQAAQEAARDAARDANGAPGPAFILQLTHSGRYSRPGRKPAPVIAAHNAVLDPRHNLPADYPLITDEELDRLQEAFVRAAVLAAECGFDGVDIKSCHRYLCSELLSCFTREGSRYGGSYENRTRFLRETADKIRRAAGDRLEVTCRLNIYDAIPWPYGWGVDRQDAAKADLSEPLRLIGELKAMGFGGANVTVANPYFNPYVNRPADWMIAHMPDAPEHPLEGVARLVKLAGQVQKTYPDMCMIGTGYSWLRQYVPYFAAATIARGWASVVGLGRGSFAYPDFARDILTTGRMDPRKVCVACSSCTQIMRDGGRSGCVVRDEAVYGPIFRLGRDLDPAVLQDLAARCRRCADADCSAACPAGVDVPGFLGALADGDEKGAYRILSANNILPCACGAVCPVEVQCQSACIQNCLAGSPVPIARIQKNLSLLAIQNGWAALEVPAAASGKKVAVVGAGPGGLGAAAGLLRAGHSVTIIDRAEGPGGKLAGVIPPSRIRAEDARAEIHAVFAQAPPDRLQWRFGQALGVARRGEGVSPLRGSVPLPVLSSSVGSSRQPERGQDALATQGRDALATFTLDDLFAEGFAAVVLAMGLAGGTGLSSGPRPAGVMEAAAFLSHMHGHPDHKCPTCVVVLGGGNTAVDAAVCAARRGASDVYLVYRRSYLQMPAWPGERDEMLHAGVHLMLLCQPAGYVTDAGGRLTGVKVQRTQLGSPGPDGRRRPVAAKDGEFVLGADLAVEALGETMEDLPVSALAGVERTADGLIRADGQTQATSRRGVWAVGDCANGGATVVQAIAEGLRAARDADAFLKSR